MTEASDPLEVAKRFAAGLTQANPNVFNSMVHVDVEIALGFDREIERTVLGETVQHVVKEADPGLNVRPTSSIETEGERNTSFAGASFYCRCSHSFNLKSPSNMMITAAC
jgi:hypothetical protein